jgi:hypothetical protein
MDDLGYRNTKNICLCYLEAAQINATSPWYYDNLQPCSTPGTAAKTDTALRKRNIAAATVQALLKNTAAKTDPEQSE